MIRNSLHAFLIAVMDASENFKWTLQFGLRETVPKSVFLRCDVRALRLHCLSSGSLFHLRKLWCATIRVAAWAESILLNFFIKSIGSLSEF